MVSARAKALLQLAEQGLECLSMPDFFHVVHELIKSYSLAIGRHLRQAHQDLKPAQEALARCQERPRAAHDAPEATLLVAARHTEGRRWEAAPQTSAQVTSHRQATVAAIEGLAQCHQLPVVTLP